MQTGVLQKELEQAGRIMSRWQARIRGGFGAAIILACLFLFGLSDVFIRFQKPGRLATWLVLVALSGIMIARIRSALNRKRTVQGIAAAIEKAFPRLDNHLINYLQFSQEAGRNPFMHAYVQRGVPEWRQINLKEMKNRKAHRRTAIVLVAALLLLIAPLAIAGRTWATALWRIANPFSDCLPASLTNILSVKPGDVAVRQGDSLVVNCKVLGRKGHGVWLDVQPADNKTTVYNIGKLAGNNSVQEFPYRIAKITTDLKYRFRAGDSPFPKWHSVTARPPPAFTMARLTITPPPYTQVKPRIFDALSDEVQIPRGAEVDVSLECNLPVVSATAVAKGEEPFELAQGGNDRERIGTMTIKSGNQIKLSATSGFGETAEATINFELLPDRPPEVKVLAPNDRATLSPGASPSIRFSVKDDYGLDIVAIERIPPGSAKETAGKLIKGWRVEDGLTFETEWLGADLKSERGEALAFRVVAKDNCPFEKQVTRSSTIVFERLGVEAAAQKEKETASETAARLDKVIELQRTNLEKTEELGETLAAKGGASAGSASGVEEWRHVAGQQKAIRELVSQLLRSPSQPLGGMTATVRQLHAEEMLEVIAELERIPAAEAGEQARLTQKSIRMEETILRKLTSAEIGAQKTTEQRKVSGLLAMLSELVKGETEVLSSTREYLKKGLKVGETLADKQDRLAGDVTEFIASCRNEAPAIKGTDEKFAELILKTAEECRGKQVKEDMLRAAEKLDDNAPSDAIPHEQSALAKLKALHEMLNKWQVSEAEKDLEEVVETLHEAKEKMGKLRDLQSKVIEAMKQVTPTKDKSTKEEDMMEEEIEEIQENTKQALLKVATDLHIWPELSVANELVEDCFSVFEEIKQAEGSEKAGANAVEEIGLLKPEALLELMEKAQGRMDDMEMWLRDEPEAKKWTTEAFDKEEMSKMALGALPSAMEDLIGDLLKEQEDLAKEGDDSATNQGTPDMPPGWDVLEGPTESYAAQGKSGNQTPDHKEQSGRGNIGRQGESTGESAAGSGTISEGDKNIEERMTPDPVQDGQVQADGDADEKATGGGKQGSGSASETGMAGSGTRMDATAQGSFKGLEALMAKTQALHVKASLMHLRTESLADAAHHMRQADDAIAAGLPISQVREHQKRAVASLKKAKTELNAGVAGVMDGGKRPSDLNDAVEGATTDAPAEYRKLVAEYFKSLSESL